MRIQPRHYILFLLIPFIFTILISVIATPWQTSDIEKITTEQGFDVDSIRGWMTLNDVSTQTGIPINELKQLTNISIDADENTQFKDLKLLYPNFETDLVRQAIKIYESKKTEQKYVCPYGIEEDYYPGVCPLYTDENQDFNCDYALNAIA